jgi:hypothetical protein
MFYNLEKLWPYSVPFFLFPPKSRLDQAGSSLVGPPSAAALPGKCASKYFLKVLTFILQIKQKIYVLFKRRSIYIEIHFWVIYYYQVKSIRW